MCTVFTYFKFELRPKTYYFSMRMSNAILLLCIFCLHVKTIQLDWVVSLSHGSQ